jgi:hypothetical protein
MGVYDPKQWTVHEVRTLHKVLVEHDGLFPTICTLKYMDFDRDIVLERARLIASAPALQAENDRLRTALAAARDVLDCIAINGPGDYLVSMATDALARMHELEEAETSSS